MSEERQTWTKVQFLLAVTLSVDRCIVITVLIQKKRVQPLVEVFRKNTLKIINILLRLRANGRNNSQHCCACLQWCANRCNNSQQCWDLQCIVGRIQPISLCKPCVMSVRGPNNVGRAVQTDPTLLRNASAIMEQKKCWELLAEKFDRFHTLCNNKQQHPTTCNRVCKRMEHVTSSNVGSCWPTMLRPFARGLIDKRPLSCLSTAPTSLSCNACFNHWLKHLWVSHCTSGVIRVWSDSIFFARKILPWVIFFFFWGGGVDFTPSPNFKWSTLYHDITEG